MSCNKKIGNEFENEFCELLKKCGFWVHFMNPNAAGQQPVDVIAAKNNEVFLFDCKTSVKQTFYLTRIEFNQSMAFWSFANCGNMNRYIAVKFDGSVYVIPYIDLLNSPSESVKLSEEYLFKNAGLCKK